MRQKQIPYDSLLQLRQRLDRLPHKSPERAAQVAAMATLYGVSNLDSCRSRLDPARRLVGRSGHPGWVDLTQMG